MERKHQNHSALVTAEIRQVKHVKALTDNRLNYGRPICEQWPSKLKLRMGQRRKQKRILKRKWLLEQNMVFKFGYWKGIWPNDNTLFQ